MTLPAQTLISDTALHQQMQQWRRDIHQHPELAFKETRTSQVVAQQLKQTTMEVHTGIGITGVVGVLKGKQPADRHIALRADMDALPLTELNDFAHASCHHGQMHACGHDGHTCMLLGAAMALAANPDFAGTLYFIFQPAEEGLGGAKKMIDEGLFQRFPIQEVYGMHNWPGLPAGQFAVHAGAVMASTDTFKITLQGHGGHAAMPDTTTDPILAAGHLITAVQSIVARNLHPVESGVVSITNMNGGTGADNVIPDSVELIGTIRSLKESQRQTIKQKLKQLTDHIPAAFGAKATLELEEGYPVTVNTAAEAQHCYQITQQLVGLENTHWNPMPSMGAEDFAYMLQEKPGAYIWIGNHSEATHYGLHNPHYDFNDDILPLGASYWVALAKALCPLAPVAA